MRGITEKYKSAKKFLLTYGGESLVPIKDTRIKIRAAKTTYLRRTKGITGRERVGNEVVSGGTNTDDDAEATTQVACTFDED